MINSTKILALLLAFVMCFTSVVPAHAADATNTEEDVTITMSNLEDSYNEGDTITATVTVKNGKDVAINNVSLTGSALENAVPAGYTMQMADGGSNTIDTIAAGGENSFQVQFVPTATSTPTPMPDVEEGIKVFEATFENENPFNFTDRGYQTISWTDCIDGTEHGKVVEFKRNVKDQTTFYMQYAGVGSDSSYVVYEFDVKLLSPTNTYFRMLLKDDAKNGTPIIIEGGTLKGAKATSGSVELATLDSEWHTIAIACDYKEKVFVAYVDGKKIETTNTLKINSIAANESTASKVQTLRFSVEANDELGHFMLDNVRVYEGTKPYVGDLKVPDVTENEPIKIDPNLSCFNKEKLDTSEFPGMLEGYISLHTRNGMVYQGSEACKDGIKTKLATMPVETDTGFLVVAKEICEILNVSYVSNGSTVTINGKDATVTEKDGKLWIDAKYFFEEILGKVVSIDTEANSDGMMIAGDKEFKFPSAALFSPGSASNLRSALQNLNDYLFFERPSSEQILSKYAESDLNGVHPRIMATAKDFERIKKEVTSNTYMSNWYQQLLVEANALVEDRVTPLKYELRDGVRLLEVANEALDNMYILGMAYQLTGEKKYAERAWVDLEAISNFKDWYAIPLDTGTFCAAAAIGYDWIYDYLNDDQKKLVEQAVYNNGYTLACDEYMGKNALLGRTTVSYNQCAIINTGFTMAALAFMDVYPTESAYIASNAIKAADINLTEFGPDGAYREGAGYWQYTTQFVAKLLSSLDIVFDTCFSLDLCEGLSTTAEYMMYVQSDRGIFNYNDSKQNIYYCPEFFYLSNKYKDPSITSASLYMYKGKLQGSTYASDLALSLLWLDTSIGVDESSLPKLDIAYYGEGLVTMRDTWEYGSASFVGIHGGFNQIVHGQLDAGSFVYDYSGVRWIKEIGSTPYDTSVSGDYNDNGGRWRLFRSKAEAHNTIVIVNSNTSKEGTDQVVKAGASLERFENDNKGGIAVLDMSAVYNGLGAEKAKRGLFFTDDRSSVVIRDEITLSEANSTVYSFFLTDTAVEIAEDRQTATLTHISGQQMQMEFITTGNGNATLGCGPATRELLGTTSPINVAPGNDDDKYDAENPNLNRIYVKLEGASGDVAITVKLTPIGVKSTPVSDYNKSIAEWKVPEGEIAAKPEIQSVVIDGSVMDFNSSNQTAFLNVIGKYDTVPEATVTVDESKYTYQVTSAESTNGGTTVIVVEDKTDPSIFTIYKVNFVEIPEPKEFEGMTSLQVVNVEASDEPQTDRGHYRWSVLDNDINTRWTSQGGGNWIQLELEEATTIDNLMIAFYKTKGYIRAPYFGISVSTDGENWEQVWNGKGKLTDENGLYEQFELGGKTAKYIRLDCNGNTQQGITRGWNNISEIVVTKNEVVLNEAKIGSTYYETLQAAIAAAGDLAESATEDVVITLLDDASEENLTIGEKITLDLNGNTLTASTLASFGGYVIDNSDDKDGLLKVAEDKVIFSTTTNNPQMPVYNGTDGYVFADIVKQEQRNSDENADIFELVFRPSLGTGTVVNNTLLASGGNAAKITIGIRLEGADANGTPFETKILVYDDTMIDTVYSEGKAFYIKASGVNSFKNVKITPFVQSQLNNSIVWNGTTFGAN